MSPVDHYYWGIQGMLRLRLDRSIECRARASAPSLVLWVPLRRQAQSYSKEDV